MTIEPINDHICVKRKDAEEKRGGIIIPTAAQDPPLLGYVVAIGPAVKQIAEDDQIVFAQYTGVSVNLSDEDFLMMREEEVLAIVK